MLERERKRDRKGKQNERKRKKRLIEKERKAWKEKEMDQINNESVCIEVSKEW